jgi:uncharacterized protein (TIGR03000 family)
MYRPRLPVLSLLALVLATTATGAPPAGTTDGGHGSGGHSGSGGHGGGAGHSVAGPSGGLFEGFRPGFRHFHYYPGWFGVGLGCGYGWGYGYPYYPYGYPIYVDPICAAAPNGGPPPGPAAAPVRLTETDVILSVHVPPDAVVRINGVKTTQTGPRREFMSSGLSPGRTYTFDVNVQWTGPDGRGRELERRLTVQGGERRTMDFTMPPSPRQDVPAQNLAGR